LPSHKKEKAGHVMMMISQGYFKQQQKFHDKDTNTCNPLFGFIYISTMAIYVHLYVICTGAASGDHIIASSLVYHDEQLPIKKIK